MSIRNKDLPTIKSVPSSNDKSISTIEKRLEELETKINTPSPSSRIDLTSLPDLPPRKQTPIEQRLSALENKVEELVKLLSE